MIMPETAAQKLEQVLDADKGKEGLQLPKNFEETFKKRENRDLLVKSVNSKFENSDAIKQNKDAIIGACKTEINSWGESLPSDAGKVAVLYLYNALNGKTLYKEDLPTAFDDFKKNKTEVASVPTTGVEGKDAKKTEVTITGTEAKDAKTTVNTIPVKTESKDGKTTEKTEVTKTPVEKKSEITKPTLKDQVTSIPAFKDNEDIQRSLQRIEETQKDLGTTKEQLKTTRETITSKGKEITQKQQELSTVEKDITTANTIPDEIAKEGALSKLTTKKEQLTGELHNLEDQIKPLQRTERRLSGQENFLTRQLENRNKDLTELVEPTKNKYEQSKESITQTINGLKKSIDTKYSPEQQKLIDTEWLKTQLKQQEEVLAQLDQSLTGINTVLGSLNPSTAVPQENLADKKADNTSNPNFESPRIQKEQKITIPDRTKKV